MKNLLSQLSVLSGIRDSGKLRYGLFVNVPQESWNLDLASGLLKQSPRKGDWIQHINPNRWTAELLELLLQSNVDSSELIPYIPVRFKTPEVADLIIKKFGVDFDFMPKSLTLPQKLLSSYSKMS